MGARGVLSYSGVQNLRKDHSLAKGRIVITKSPTEIPAENPGLSIWGMCTLGFPTQALNKQLPLDDRTLRAQINRSPTAKPAGSQA